MKKDIQILHLEDAPADVVMVNHELRKGGLAFRTHRVDTREGFMAALNNDPPDIILSDHGLPEFDGFSALALAQARCPEVPFIFVTDSLGEDMTIETLTNGATDYVLKKNLARLVPVIRRALRDAQNRLKQAEREQELRQSEERFRHVVEACPDALLVIYPTGEIAFANAATVRLLGGKTAVDLAGRNLAELLPAGRWERVLELATQARAEKEPGCPFAEQLIRADGELLDVEVSMTDVEFGDKRALQFAVHDVTERRRAEQVLRNREARRDAILQTTLDAVIFIDHRGVVQEWNPAAEKIFGYTHSDAVGRELAELIVPPALRGRHRDGLQHYLASGESRILGQRIEMLALHASGNEFQVELAVVRVPGSKPPLFIGYLRDITERRQSEQELRSLNAALERRVAQRTARVEEISRELELLSYSISHDFRAPLRHIACFAEVLETEGSWRLDPTSRRHLGTVATSARHAQALLDGLLTFSRIGRAEMRVDSVDLTGLVEDARRQLQEHSEGRKIAWNIGKLPKVQGDHELLRQAVLQLLSNAVKYTRPREEARIEIGGSAAEPEVVVSVRDNGVGFDMKYAHKLFGIFQRLHLPEQFEGIGIGLANVRRIIQRHGGRTWAESNVDAGATFYFSIPQLASLGENTLAHQSKTLPGAL
jgi:PAS domain S-box-containing protein